MAILAFVGGRRQRPLGRARRGWQSEESGTRQSAGRVRRRESARIDGDGMESLSVNQCAHLRDCRALGVGRGDDPRLPFQRRAALPDPVGDQGTLMGRIAGRTPETPAVRRWHRRR